MRNVNEQDFYQDLGKSRGLVLVFFTGAICASCRHWRGLLREYEMASTDLEVWEVDAGENPGLAREYEVFHLPSLFLFRDGRYWRPIQSEARPHALRAAVEEALSLPPLEPP